MQAAIPNIGIQGEKGVLNGRGVFGCLLRRMRIARQTEENASKVPSETSLLRTPIGNKPANTIATSPTMIVDI